MFLVPVGVFVLGMLAGSFDVTPDFWVGMASMICISMGIFAINGYYDRHIDERKGKPFALRNPQKALVISLSVYGAGLCIAVFGGRPLFFVMVMFTIASIVYSVYCTKLLFVKNGVAAGISALFFLAGGYVVGRTDAFVIIWTAIIFLAICSMEIIKDIEDVEVDRGMRKTIPMVFSMAYIRRIILMLMLSASALVLTVRTERTAFYLFWLLTTAAFLLGWRLLPQTLDSARAKLARRSIYAGLWLGLVLISFSL
jgi:4-hydroxybenzoate polyprenyltransferase